MLIRRSRKATPRSSTSPFPLGADTTGAMTSSSLHPESDSFHDPESGADGAGTPPSSASPPPDSAPETGGGGETEGASATAAAADGGGGLSTNGGAGADSENSIERRYLAERKLAKIRHWKESEYAAGCVEPTWADELESVRRRQHSELHSRAAASSSGTRNYGGPGSGDDGDDDYGGELCAAEMEPTTCGCVYVSALVCSRLGAGRVGNMVVLRERYVLVEVEDNGGDGGGGDGGGESSSSVSSQNKKLENRDPCADISRESVYEEVFLDEEDVSNDLAAVALTAASDAAPRRRSAAVAPLEIDAASEPSSSPASILSKVVVTTTIAAAATTTTKTLVRKREFQFILGPFWPMLIFVTYPIIFGMSGLVVWRGGLTGQSTPIVFVWASLTFLLIYSLFNTGFRDPGILTRRRSPPPTNPDEEEGDARGGRRIGFRMGNEDGPWRWSDQGQTYRPRNAYYDTDCKVVIEDFDHTCPWTGTAIGKKNMSAFQMFVGLVFACLIMDILLLTDAVPRS